MRRALIIIAILATPVFSGAGDVEFSLNLKSISLAPRPDPRTEARLAEWNSPMGRLTAAFNQQQAWVMRGTQPGLERVNGVAIRVKAQHGVPVEVLAATMEAGIDVSRQQVKVDWLWRRNEEEPAMSLEEEISLLLGRRLVPQ
ncbi:MAG: hypothetical protein KAJ97_05470 [Acidobacteria bacterium]|nr:hypothetical protein [Acidobacteriota bacterium]